jgi:hypothetical protein
MQKFLPILKKIVIWKIFTPKKIPAQECTLTLDVHIYKWN